MITKEEIYKVIPKKILREIIVKYELNLFNSVHGIDHWYRVLINGLRIAEKNGANKNIIIAFAFFHDIKRMNDDDDPEHGARAAKYLLKYKYKLNLNKEELKKTMDACYGHTSEKYSDDLDIATCWDADRLDLYRVGIVPSPEYLNNDFSKTEDEIKSAQTRSWAIFDKDELKIIEDLKKDKDDKAFICIN